MAVTVAALGKRGGRRMLDLPLFPHLFRQTLVVGEFLHQLAYQRAEERFDLGRRGFCVLDGIVEYGGHE